MVCCACNEHARIIGMEFNIYTLYIERRGCWNTSVCDKKRRKTEIKRERCVCVCVCVLSDDVREFCVWRDDRILLARCCLGSQSFVTCDGTYEKYEYGLRYIVWKHVHSADTFWFYRIV